MAKKRPKSKRSKAGTPAGPARPVLATALHSAANMAAVAASSGLVLLFLIAAKRLA